MTRRDVLALMGGLFAGVSGGSQAAPSVNSSIVRKVKFNIWLPEGVENPAKITALGENLGIKFHAATVYRDWSEDLSPDVFRAFHDENLLTQLVWENVQNGKAISDDDILGGKYDAYLDRAAKMIAGLGYPVRISTFPELNLKEQLWFVATPEAARKRWKAYRYITERFEDAGATRIEWVFTLNRRWTGDTGKYDQFYFPEDANFIYAIGVDGFNWGGDEWESFSQVFNRSLQEVHALDSTKPIYIMEAGSAEDLKDPLKKAKWIQNMCTYLLTGLPIEVTLFWETKERNWRYDSTPQTYEAAKQYFPLIAR